jgi:hypothetical protein
MCSGFVGCVATQPQKGASEDGFVATQIALKRTTGSKSLQDFQALIDEAWGRPEMLAAAGRKGAGPGFPGRQSGGEGLTGCPGASE